MRAKIGARAVALRNADDTTIYLYGRGTYVGPQAVPYWDDDAEFDNGQTFRQYAEQIVQHQMSLPQEEFVWQGIPTGMDQFGNPMGDARTLDERVAEHLRSWSGNPRVDLDSGGSAYGYFCWWTSEEKYGEMVKGRTEVLVPLPDPLPHSMLTRPRPTGEGDED